MVSPSLCLFFTSLSSVCCPLTWSVSKSERGSAACLSKKGTVLRVRRFEASTPGKGGRGRGGVCP